MMPRLFMFHWSLIMRDLGALGTLLGARFLVAVPEIAQFFAMGEKNQICP